MRRLLLGAACAVLAVLPASTVGAGQRDVRLVDAAMRQDRETVRTLLKSGADPNVAQPDGATALHWAAHWDNSQMVDLLLGAKAAVNTANELGATPLWLASLNSSSAIVGKLMRAGADPNLALPSGETPLMTAARIGNVDIVKQLLAHKADVNATENSQGQTALMWATAGRHPDVIRVLIEGGADVKARSQIRRRRIGTELGGYNAAAAREIEKGGYSALLFAAQQGTLESLELLVAAGADVNDMAPEGTSALVVAAHSGHEAASAFLLEKGADPNAAGAGYTALHAAILRGDADLVKKLLARGANPNAPLLKATPARRNSADYAMEFALVGATPFWLASYYLEPTIMRALALSGADATVAREGVTPLMAAIQARRRVEPGVASDPIRDEQLVVDAAELVIELGADVNASTKDGNTALHLAATRRLNRVIEFLAGHGANLDAKNAKDQTPLMTALTGGGRGNAGASRTAGANPTADLLRKLGAKQ